MKNWFKTFAHNDYDSVVFKDCSEDGQPEIALLVHIEEIGINVTISLGFANKEERNKHFANVTEQVASAILDKTVYHFKNLIQNGKN